MTGWKTGWLKGCLQLRYYWLSDRLVAWLIEGMSATALTAAFVKTESWIGQVVGCLIYQVTGVTGWLVDRSGD